jgi:hypothetical protein
MWWRVAALCLAVVFAPGLASAQYIQPSGQFTPGHAVRCLNSLCTAVGDAGGANGAASTGPSAQKYLTELGVTNTGTPFCINDALVDSASGYHQFCFGANALGVGLISYNAYGGATPLALQCNVNGVVSNCLSGGTPIYTPIDITTAPINPLPTTFCSATIFAGGGAFYPITIGAASGYPGFCPLTITNTDAAAGKKLVVNGLTTRILWPGQSISYKINNAAWVVTSDPGKWTTPGTFYVNGTGSPQTCGTTGALTCQPGNDANDGLTIASTLATVNQALSLYQAQISYYTLSVNLSHGVQAPVFCDFIPGLAGVTGDNNSTAAAIIQAPTSGTAIDAQDQCSISFASIAVEDSVGNNAGSLINVTKNGGLIDLSNVTIGTCNISCVQMSASGAGAVMNVISGITITRGADIAFEVVGDAYMNFGGGTPVTLTGTPAYHDTFALVGNGGVMSGLGTGSFTGAATGSKCQIYSGSTFDLLAGRNTGRQRSPALARQARRPTDRSLVQCAKSIHWSR